MRQVPKPYVWSSESSIAIQPVGLTDTVYHPYGLIRPSVRDSNDTGPSAYRQDWLVLARQAPLAMGRREDAVHTHFETPREEAIALYGITYTSTVL